MADKGCTIDDIITSTGCLIEYPSISRPLWAPEDVVKTQVIPSLRIYVERAINK